MSRHALLENFTIVNLRFKMRKLTHLPLLEALYAVKYSSLRKLSLTLFLLVYLSLNTCMAQCDPSSGTIQGFVFNDENANGIIDNDESGAESIMISVFDSENLYAGQAITAANGEYEVTNLNDGEVYRVEFSFTAPFQSTVFSPNSPSNVRFANAPDCQINFGVFDPNTSCDGNPELILSCFVRGNIGQNNHVETLIGLEHNFNGQSVVTKYASKGETGSVWSVAYDPYRKKIFSSAFVKQYASLTEYGADAIFETDISGATNSTNLFVKLSDLGINTGTLTTEDVFNCNYGNDVGRIGLGSMVLSEDRKHLYIVNLFDKSIIKLRTSNPTAQNTEIIAIPDPNCVGGESAPFALKILGDKLFVGVTCTAEHDRDEANSTATVYEMDLNSKSFTQIFTTNYIKGFWYDVPQDSYATMHWLTDIDFTDDGNMLLSFTDRVGHRYCNDMTERVDQQNPDLLMVWNNNGVWTLENNGTAGDLVGSGVGNGEGPGGGEFFGFEHWVKNPTYHSETALGSIVVHPGTGSVVATVYDPEIDSYSGGLHRYSTTDGSKLGTIELYSHTIDPLFGKATGFGEVVATCQQSPSEIGNYVWYDENGNGIQDSNEPGLENVVLNLYNDECDLVGVTVTDENGVYLFNSSNVDVDLDGVPDGLEVGETYFVQIEPSLKEEGDLIIYNINGEMYGICTNADADNLNSNNDSNEFSTDSQCTKLEGSDYIEVVVSDNSQINHNYDISLCAPDLMYDLALIKLIVSDELVELGDTATFEMQVHNQGTMTATSVTVSDYIIEGYRFEESLNPDWRLRDGVAKTKINEGIEPGAFSSVFIHLIVEPVPSLSYTNIAEISGSIDQFNSPGDDKDSTADDDPQNDAGGIPNSPNSDNTLDGDGTVDEDDHDPARVLILDLALKKELKFPETEYQAGDLVEYVITIYNQGSEDANEIQIVDYIPEELEFVPGLSQGWEPHNSEMVIFRYPDVLPRGASDVIEVTMRIKADVTNAEIVNYAEIMQSKAVGNDTSVDFDSKPDMIPDNDKGGMPESITDNETRDYNVIDEDDHDPALLRVATFDLALTKTPHHNQVEAGEDITFTINVFNQGSIVANEVVIYDHIPAGMTLNDDDWSYLNNDPTTGIAVYTINVSGGIRPAMFESVDITLRLDDNAVTGEYTNIAEIFSAQDIDGNDQSDNDRDSTPDADPSNDNGGMAGSATDDEIFDDGTIDEDDHDPARVIFVDGMITTFCTELQNATTNDNGQFRDKITVVSATGETWYIHTVEGFFDVASAAPPAAPTPYATGPGGFNLMETALGNGVSQYMIEGIHVDGQGYNIVVTNGQGAFETINSGGCEYPTAPIEGRAAVCINVLETYTTMEIAGATYMWTLSGGGAIVGPDDASSVDVMWGAGTGSFTLTLEVTAPGIYFPPNMLTVNVGSTDADLACRGSINISAGPDCETIVTPQMLLTSAADPDASYVVILMDAHGNIIPNATLTSEHIGQQGIVAKLMEGCTQNSCWTSVLYEDKIAPMVDCVDITISCNDMLTYDGPIVNDNCDNNAELILLEEVVTPLICNNDFVKIVDRVYQAEDASGNVSMVCMQQISLTRVDLADIDFPDNLMISNGTNLSCGNSVPVDEDGNPSTLVTGVPTIGGNPVFPNHYFYCNIVTDYNDQVVFDDGCTKKIVRTWSVFDLSCSTTLPVMDMQTIEIHDDTPPEITCPEDITMTTDGQSCFGNVWLPPAEVHDECVDHDEIEVDITYPDGFLDNSNGGWVKIPVGVHTITYTAYDKCYNSSTCEIQVTVEDHSAPVMVCKENTAVSLSLDGEADIPATTFDSGSYDDCGVFTTMVRRMEESDCNCDEAPVFDGMDYLGEYNEHHYYVSQKEVFGPMAIKLGFSFDEYTVTINDADENNWLNSTSQTMFPGERLFIGLNDADHEGDFVWANGDPVTYTNWQNGEPNGNGDHVILRNNGTWREVTANRMEKFVLELEDPCAFNNKVKYCCDDVAKEDLMVVYRMVDKQGNFNECMVEVEVQDKFPPKIFCPADLTIDCSVDYDLTDLSAYGVATGDDACDFVITEEVMENVTQCRVGSITRTFTATDANGSATCNQTITIVNPSPFVEDDITWPEDFSTTSGCKDEDLHPDNLPEGFGYPEIIEDECDLVEATFKDHFFNFVEGEDACFKILRKWKVIDWCQRETDGSIWSRSYDQVIEVRNTTAPAITSSCDSIQQCSFDAQCFGAEVTLMATAVDDCTPDDRLLWRYEIDLHRDGIDIITNSGTGNMTNATGTYPIGEHIIFWSFEDGCGNVTTCSQIFEVISCKPPVAYCIDGFSIGLTPMDLDGDGEIDTEMACIFVDSIDIGSYHPCGTEINLSFDIDTTVNKVTFDCFDLGEQEVTLYVTDVNGYVSQCVFTVEVQDNNEEEFCEDPKDCINFPDEIFEVTGCPANLDPDVIGSMTTVDPDCICDDFDVEFEDFLTAYPNVDCAYLERVWTVTFNCGNNPIICTFNQTIIARDQVPPTITCPIPSTFTASADPGFCEAFVNVDVASVEGDCSSGLVITNDSPFADSNIGDASGTYPVGSTVVTYTATNNCGLISTCQITVVVLDGEGPLCELNPITITLDENNMATIDFDDINGNSSDLCGGDLIAQVNPTEFDCDDLGENTVTVVLMDESGNTTNCMTTVTILDEVDPNPCNIDDISVSLTIDGTVTIFVDQLNPTGTDDCGNMLTYTVMPDMFDCDDIGPNTVVVTATDESGNTSSCNAIVTVTDDVNPECTVDDITVALDDNGMVTVNLEDFNTTGMDACGNMFTFTGNEITYSCTNVGMNSYIVTVTDESGNFSTCEAIVTVTDMVAPTCTIEDITITLDDMGMATITTGDLNVMGNDDCGSVVDFVLDNDSFDCDDVGQNTVTVTVTDDSGNTSTCQAMVTVMDEVAPDCVLQNITVNIGTNNMVILDGIDLDNGSTDACGSIVDFTVEPAFLTCEELGENIVTVTVTDDSGNTTTCQATVTVNDVTEPVCSIMDITVSLDENGEVQLMGPELDNNSSAGCDATLDFMVDPSFYACNDIGVNTVTVTVTDDSGNSASCTAMVTVQDTLPPSLVCPGDLTLACTDDISDLSIFGMVTFTDNCTAQIDIEEVVTSDLNSCNEGVVIRTFIATDGFGNTSQCSQNITINGPEDPLMMTDITLSMDTLFFDGCMSIDPTLGDIEIPVIDSTAADCFNVSYDFVDVNLNPGGDCMDTIERTWILRDSCQLDGTGAGVFMFDQVLVINDNMAPELVLPGDTLVQCPGFIDLGGEVIDCNPNVTVTNNSQFADDNNSADASGTYPTGIYNIIVQASDECGNFAVESYTLTVQDTMAPTIDHKKQFYNIDDSGVITITPLDFICFYDDNCTDSLDATFFFTEPFTPGDTLNPPTTLIASIDLTCDDLTPQDFIYMIAYDIEGNFHRLRSAFTLTDNDNLCPPNIVDVEGVIRTDASEEVENVHVALEGSSMIDYQTLDDGYYAFPNMPIGGSYNVIPSRNDNHLNGVSTLDLALIQRHLLGVELFQTPYQHIAADVNRSNHLSIADISELRKLLFGYYEQLPNNTSWRMVDASYEFNNVSNPLQEEFEESYLIQDLNSDMEVDFVGIKVGDIDNTALANYNTVTDIETRESMDIIVETTEAVRFDNYWKIPVKLASHADILGLQLELQNNGNIKSFASGVFDISESNYMIREEYILLSAFNSEGLELNSDETLFYLIVDSKEIGADDIQISEEWFNSEVYSKEQEISKLRLYTGTDVSDNDFALYQNQPNPWSQSTSIGFKIPKAQIVTLNVYDVTGQLILTRNSEFESGFNAIQVNASEINSHGILYYELINELGSRLKNKMIFIK